MYVYSLQETVSYKIKASFTLLKLYSPTQSIFQKAFFKCEPPIITTCTDSPYTSDSFVIANRALSKMVIGIYHGLSHLIAHLGIPKPCLTIAGVVDIS